MCLNRGGERKADTVPTLSLRTLCLCVERSPLSFAVHGLPDARRQTGPSVSSLPATLAGHVEPKSFVCHSYEKQVGVGSHVPFFDSHSPLVTSATRRNARNSNPLIRLLHNSRTPGVGGYASLQAALQPTPSGTCPTAIASQILPSAFDFQLSAFYLRFFPPISIHQSGSRVTDHESRITPP